MKDIMGHLKSLLGLSGRPAGDARTFQTVFGLFREVLGSNNQALEIITDMGEKLGGDYLFDIVYIKGAYAKLGAAVRHSLKEFDQLTRNRYPDLQKVLDRIDSRILGMIFDADAASGERVYFYEDLTWYMSDQVGGKTASLAELKNYLNLNVPAAFAVTVRAFDEFMDYNDLRQDIQAAAGSYADDPDGASQAMQKAVMDAVLPPALEADIGRAVEKIRSGSEGECFLAVRSSAEEEDSDYSFAGQFETVLNVPATKEAVTQAYKRVVASLFSVRALSYLEKLGYGIGRMRMAVACVAMVDAVSSGVMYTASGVDRDTILINATWGLGEAVVEGQTDSDLFRVRKGDPPEVVEEKAGRKEFMIVNLKGGGTERIKTPPEMHGRPALTPQQVLELSRLGNSIELHFRRPQDIEWAIDKRGGIFILQSRPLRLEEESGVPLFREKQPQDDSGLVFRDRGLVVQKGAAAGAVFVVTQQEDLKDLPKGSILVAGNDSSNFVRVMPYVSAIITDVGSPTSHMASLCREFRIPTIVNAGDATKALRNGQKITLYAGDEGNSAVYDGIRRELVAEADTGFLRMEEIYEYRKKRYVLRHISPLNLVDPLMDNFSPEKCKTLHDVLRFIHEKSVAELIESARYGNTMLRKHAAVKLELPVPAGIIAVDIGGGLSVAPENEKATIEQITSIPLRAVVRGMTHPGVWQSHAVALKVNDFLSSMMRMSDITTDDSSYVGYNVAVISEEYLNLSLRFGYHFNMLDAFCSENTRNNHIYFRFVGGATDIVKRSRRVQLLADILKEYGFNISTKGDLIIARLANIRRPEMEEILDRLGRLIAYTRQLDAQLHDDGAVERYARNFLEEKYEI